MGMNRVMGICAAVVVAGLVAGGAQSCGKVGGVAAAGAGAGGGTVAVEAVTPSGKVARYVSAAAAVAAGGAVAGRITRAEAIRSVVGSKQDTVYVHMNEGVRVGKKDPCRFKRGGYQVVIWEMLSGKQANLNCRRYQALMRSYDQTPGKRIRRFGDFVNCITRIFVDGESVVSGEVWRRVTTWELGDLAQGTRGYVTVIDGNIVDVKPADGGWKACAAGLK